MLGASWYLLSIERHATCWKSLCRHDEGNFPGCSLKYLDCKSLRREDRQIWANSTQVFNSCDPNNDNTSFKYGIFENALTQSVVSSPFLEKYFYCLWWGLQNLRYGFQTLVLRMLNIEGFFAALYKNGKKKKFA